jgi:NAD+ synthase
MGTLAVALAQLNPTVGDLGGNLRLVRKYREAAAREGADVVVFPELILVGYPPEDLVLRPALVDACRSAVEELARELSSSGPALLVSAPWREGGNTYNAAVLLGEGRTQVRFKRELPNYGVFDEKRVFTPGPLPEPMTIRGTAIGVPICEDMWTAEVSRHLAKAGAQLLVVPNGSPFETEKPHRRIELARQRVAECGVGLIYVNQVGGQDELVFDGASFALNQDGAIAAVAPSWREALVMTRWDVDGGRLMCRNSADWIAESRLSSMYHAMVLGLRDYVTKNAFRGVVIGLSGGIDSALTAAVAVDALGPERVLGVRLPSRFSSEGSLHDAAETGKLLGIRVDTVSIQTTVEQLEATLAPPFRGYQRDVTEENLQARVRGVILMAYSNKFGHLLVTTGNKSEMSVGYATLYGDMCGGYSVLKDVYKTDVYRLSHWRNEHRPAESLGPAGHVIPDSSIVKAPSAELRPDQTDQDSLPPYDELDAILIGLVEDQASIDEIAERGLNRDTVDRVQRLLYAAEYKRRQAPPGVKLTRRSFGRDRRYPLTNRYRDPALLPAVRP